jgi:hypothetical protein
LAGACASNGCRSSHLPSRSPLSPLSSSLFPGVAAASSPAACEAREDGAQRSRTYVMQSPRRGPAEGLVTTTLGGAAPPACGVHDPRREVLVRGELARREEKRAAEQAHDGRRHERRSSPARHAHPHRPLRSVVERLVSVELPALALRCTRTADERTVANRRERARAAAGGSKTRC